LRGRLAFALSLGTLMLGAGAARAAVCGSAYFNHPVNWWNTGALYFSVAGAPANRCGDLWGHRNSLSGNFVKEAGGWICTDSSGNATQGPWYTSGTGDDETGYFYIDWGTCTSPAVKHVWDVGAPWTSIAPGYPGSFSGTAYDEAWGAGFNDSWSACWGEYYDITANRWWNLYSYSSTLQSQTSCSFTGSAGLTRNWTTAAWERPDLSDHVPGHRYRWMIRIWDGGQMGTHYVEFTY
jgi:hypothetical protein